MNDAVYAFVDARDVPVHDRWLSAGERAVAARLRVRSRRWHWRLGRWAAKEALVGLGVVPADALTRLDVRARSDGAPEALLDGDPLAGGVSISHRAGRGLAVASASVEALGCDVEWIEPRSEAFVADYYGADERARITAACPIERLLLTTLLWSAKESVLKVLRCGLRTDPRDVRVAPAVAPTVDGWCPFTAVATCDGTRTFHGWWRQAGRHVLTAVTGGEPPRARAGRGGGARPPGDGGTACKAESILAPPL